MRWIYSLKSRLVTSIFMAISVVTAFAQDRSPAATAVGRPTLVVSTSKIDQLLASVSYLLRSVSQPEIGGMVTMSVNNFSRGLDRTRPIGFVASLNEAGNPVPVIMLPISDVKAFFAGLVNFGEPEDLGDGLFTMDVGFTPVFAKQINQWLLVGQQEEAVKNFKQVPAELLQSLATRYDVGVKLDVQSVPEAARDFFLGQMKESYQRSIAPQKARLERELDSAESSASTAEEKASVAKRRAMMKTAEQIQTAQIEDIEDTLKNTSQIVVGLAIDSANKQVFLEAATEFVAGSKLDSRIARSATAKTKFAGVPSEGQAASLAFTDILDPAQIPQFEQWVNASVDAFTANSKETPDITGLIDFVKEIKTIVIKSIRDGIVDGSASITLKDGLNIVTAAYVSDGQALVAELQKASDKLKPGDAMPQIQFNASKHQGASIHVGSVKLPRDANETARKIFSDSVKFAIGTADKAVYVAVGSQAEANLKATLDRVAAAPSAAGSPMEFKIDLGPVLDYVQSIQPSPIVDAMIQTAQNYSANDMLTVKSQLVPHGAVVRFTIEEGVLRAVGSAAKAGSGNRRGGGF